MQIIVTSVATDNKGWVGHTCLSSCVGSLLVLLQLNFVLFITGVFFITGVCSAEDSTHC